LCFFPSLFLVVVPSGLKQFSSKEGIKKKELFKRAGVYNKCDYSRRLKVKKKKNKLIGVNLKEKVGRRRKEVFTPIVLKHCE